MHRLTILLLLLFPIFTHAQQEASKWFFGKNAGLNFSSGVPEILADGQIDTNEGVASISNSEGALLFYTEGTTVWNRNHLPMPSGTGLLGHYSSTQSAIIVPVIGDQDRYYIFTVPQLAGGDGLRYSIVNMQLNNGLGDIETKNIFLQSSICEKVTAVKHCNGRDIWVIVHGFNSANFYAYLITAAGINTTPVVSTTGQFVFGHNSDFTIGYMKVSPDGKKIAAAYSLIGADLLDFDNSTGIVSNGQGIFLPDEPYWQSTGAYGVEFSPNSKYLYISGDYLNWTTINQHSYLLQYDVSLPTHLSIQQSKYAVYDELSGSWATNFAALQTGPDGKIYLSERGKEYLSVINQPDIQGYGCEFSYGSVNIHNTASGTGFCMWGLPSFIQSYFKKSFSVHGACQGMLLKFEYEKASNELSVKWDFGDPASGLSNESILDAPEHHFSEEGEFTVKLIRYTPCGNDTVSKKVQAGVASVYLGKDTILCGENQYIIQPETPTTNYTLHWQDGSTTPDFTTIKEGLYWAELINTKNGCMHRDSINVSFKPLPVFNLGEDLNKCEGESTTLTISSNGTHLWNDGSSLPSLTISQGGLYWLELTEEGCKQRDSIEITYHNYPKINLGNDTSFCEGNSLHLNAQNVGMQYRWQDNSIAQAFNVSHTGKYWVTINNYGCTRSDTINVVVKDKPAFTLGIDTIICEGTPFTLTPKISKGSSLDYKWNTGNQTPSIIISSPGRYALTLTNECGADNDAIDIIKGTCKLYVPSAFTPNGDGINDMFKPSYTINLSVYNLSIYNRWGNLVFQTQDILKGWDGKYKGQPQNNDSFIWIIRYKYIGEENEHLMKGSLILLR